MNKEQAKKEAEKYKSFVKNKFKNRTTNEIFIVEMINENPIADTKDKYEVLVSFRSEKKWIIEQRLVEDINVFLKIYANA